MAHCRVPEAEEILDTEFQVLDKGFVRLVDYMGCDQRIVQAARVSYGAGTKTFRQDKGLISYLLRNRHTTPFEQVVLTFHVKMPIFVARQWLRHRTARVNEISGRYSVMEAEFYEPAPDAVAQQSSNNKQGRDASPIDPETAELVRAEIAEQHDRSYRAYEALLNRGIARELARIDLPLSLYTQLYWQIDLHNLFHFLELRSDQHAQYEIRCYANTMLDIVRRVCPIASEAFDEYVREAVTFSGGEHSVLLELLHGSSESFETLAKRHGLGKKARERLVEKLGNPGGEPGSTQDSAQETRKEETAT